MEDVALAPALEDPLLERREGLLGVDWAESGHRAGFWQSVGRAGAAWHGQPASVTEPSSSMVQLGLWATSHGWPSGSMKIPE